MVVDGLVSNSNGLKGKEPQFSVGNSVVGLTFVHVILHGQCTPETKVEGHSTYNTLR